MQKNKTNDPCGNGRRRLMQGLGATGLAAAFPGAFAGETCSDPNYAPPDYPVACQPPAATGPQVRFAPPGGAIVPRKSAFDLNATEIARLRQAYAALRALSQSDPGDPRGWLQQAHVHCWYCGGGSDGNEGTEIHNGWWFLPWHRCYLYFHERILGSLIGDPTFRLSFWDWSTQAASPSHQTMPPPYTDTTGTNPLLNALRGDTATAVLPANTVGPVVMTRVMGQPTFDLFGGAPQKPNYYGGALEAGPHGAVHNWTGTDGDTMPNCGDDMGVLATAAQDPIFFAHHANIDRLWPMWLAQGGGRSNPAVQAWLNQRWIFFDENKRLVSISVADVLATERLGYDYQPVAGAPELMAQGTTAPKTMKTQATKPAALTVFNNPKGQSLGTVPASHTLKLPAPHLLFMGKPASAAAALPHYTLRITDIEVPMHRSAQVLVFINRPDATADTPLDSANYAGTIGAVAHTRGASAHAQHAKRFGFAVELSDEAVAQIRKDGKVTVTLVPLGSDGKAAASVALKYGKVTLEPR